MSLKDRLIKLGYASPDLRKHLRPVLLHLDRIGAYNLKKVLDKWDAGFGTDQEFQQLYRRLHGPHHDDELTDEERAELRERRELDRERSQKQEQYLEKLRAFKLEQTFDLLRELKKNLKRKTGLTVKEDSKGPHLPTLVVLHPSGFDISVSVDVGRIQWRVMINPQPNRLLRRTKDRPNSRLLNKFRIREEYDPKDRLKLINEVSNLIDERVSLLDSHFS